MLLTNSDVPFRRVLVTFVFTFDVVRTCFDFLGANVKRECVVLSNVSEQYRCALSKWDVLVVNFYLRRSRAGFNVFCRDRYISLVRDLVFHGVCFLGGTLCATVSEGSVLACLHVIHGLCIARVSGAQASPSRNRGRRGGGERVRCRFFDFLVRSS